MRYNGKVSVIALNLVQLLIIHKTKIEKLQ